MILSVQDLNQLISSLGDLSAHGPVMLAWTLVRQLYVPEEAAQTQRIGNAALNLNVFTYLCKLMDTEPFNGQTVSTATASPHQQVSALSIISVLKCRVSVT